MDLALIGYGKMGKAIEEIALQRGHKIVLKVDDQNLTDFTRENVTRADVAIEFTGPHSAYENVMKCLEAGMPVVCGSTGWLEQFDKTKEYCEKKNGSFLYASNFSVGVNIFFEINKVLAQMMDKQQGYEVSMTEIHHTQKKDAPSGTAITLAEQILENLKRKTSWVNHDSKNHEELVITSERTDPAPGTHIVKYSSGVDDIEITHTAHNRKGFALGAVMAAEFLKDRRGVYSMKDVLAL